jgi:hypothetical protein
MLQGILILIIFLILLVVVIIMAAVFFVHKWVRKIKRKIHGDEDDGNPNSNDYFGRRQQYIMSDGNRLILKGEIQDQDVLLTSATQRR